MRNMEDKLIENSYLWEDENWVLLSHLVPTTQEIKYWLFNLETDEMLLVEDSEIAEFLISEMKRRGCRIVDVNSLDSNNSTIDPDDED